MRLDHLLSKELYAVTDDSVICVDRFYGGCGSRVLIRPPMIIGWTRIITGRGRPGRRHIRFLHGGRGYVGMLLGVWDNIVVSGDHPEDRFSRTYGVWVVGSTGVVCCVRTV